MAAFRLRDIGQEHVFLHGVQQHLIVTYCAMELPCLQVQALLVLPGVMVAMWLALHLRFIYEAIAPVRPGVPGTILWAVVQLTLPHVLHLYYLSKAPRQQAATPPAGAKATTLPTAAECEELKGRAGLKEGIELCPGTSSKAASVTGPSKAEGGVSGYAMENPQRPPAANDDARVEIGVPVQHTRVKVRFMRHDCTPVTWQ
jgi:hypothetical protein